LNVRKANATTRASEDGDVGITSAKRRVWFGVGVSNGIRTNACVWCGYDGNKMSVVPDD